MKKSKEVELVKPLLEELSFREELLSDEKTMAFNEVFGGIIIFPKMKWEAWYRKWIGDNSNKYYYRYIKDVESNKFIGEVAYHLEEESERYLCDIIILAKYRHQGYGTKALKLLIDEAKNNGIKVLYDEIFNDNPSINLFLKIGFEIVEEKERYSVVKINL